MKFKGYIFDMDGTLIDNGRYHILAWQEFAKRHGKTVDGQDILDWMGMTGDVYNERILGRKLTPEEQRELGEEKESLYRDIYRPHMRLPEGLLELLDRIRASGGKCALATGGPQANADFILDGLKIREHFSAVVSAGMYQRSKPDPECFLLAASLIGVAPKDCIVFEDGLPGIKAGKAAGMKVIAVTFTHPRERLLAVGADCVISGYMGVDRDCQEGARKMTFKKSVHSALWGLESWEISAHPSDPSVIADGEEKGHRLNEIYPNFPLLFKAIDAKTRLSVQVHPNEETCKVTGGEPKTEMWCALSDGPIYAGLKKGASATDVEAAVKSGRFEELLVRHEAKFGDVFFIPGGLVHAIGDGVELYEVQQSSDTTFRLYDWGRVGVDGQPRELHIEKGLQAIDYSLPVPVPCKSLDTPFFKFSQERVLGASILSTRADEFLALYSAKGEIDLDGKRVMERTSVLIPPSSTCELFGSDSILFLTRFWA